MKLDCSPELIDLFKQGNEGFEMLRTLALAGAFVLAAGAAGAADLGVYNPGTCGVLVRSPLLDQPLATMRQAVDERYERSVQVAEMTKARKHSANAAL